MKLSENTRYYDGMKLLDRRDYPGARVKFRQCLQEAPSDLWRAFFHLTVANCYIQEGHLEKAVEELKSATNIDPSPNSLVKCAEFVAEYQKDLVGATELFEAAIEMGRGISDPTFDFQAFERRTLRTMNELNIKR